MESTFPAAITYIDGIKVTSQDKNAGGFYDSLNKEQYDALQKWKEEFPDTYEKLKHIIGQPINSFIKRLENYDIEAYIEFEKVYPESTCAAVAVPLLLFI